MSEAKKKAYLKQFKGRTPGEMRHDRDQPAAQRTNVIAANGKRVVTFESERMVGQHPYAEDVANAALFRAACDPEIGLEESWKRIEELEATLPQKAQKAEEWHDDDNSVIWWRSPIEEPPYVGDPRECTPDGESTFPEDYYTHFTRLQLPSHDGQGNIL